jgi:hypothetical protein
MWLAETSNSALIQLAEFGKLRYRFGTLLLTNAKLDDTKGMSQV